MSVSAIRVKLCMMFPNLNLFVNRNLAENNFVEGDFAVWGCFVLLRYMLINMLNSYFISQTVNSLHAIHVCRKQFISRTVIVHIT